MNMNMLSSVSVISLSAVAITILSIVHRRSIIILNTVQRRRHYSQHRAPTGAPYTQSSLPLGPHRQGLGNRRRGGPWK